MRVPDRVPGLSGTLHYTGRNVEKGVYMIGGNYAEIL